MFEQYSAASTFIFCTRFPRPLPLNMHHPMEDFAVSFLSPLLLPSEIFLHQCVLKAFFLLYADLWCCSSHSCLFISVPLQAMISTHFLAINLCDPAEKWGAENFELSRNRALGGLSRDERDRRSQNRYLAKSAAQLQFSPRWPRVTLRPLLRQ